MNRSHRARAFAALLTGLASCGAGAEPFDWSRLAGAWADTSHFRYACGPATTRHRFIVAADRSSVILRSENADGSPVPGPGATRLAKVLGTGAQYLELEMPAETDPRGAPTTITLLFLGPQTYQVRMRDLYTPVIGVRCGP